MAATGPREMSARPATRLVLPLQLGDVWIAIDPTCVQEVLGTRTWMRVPGASAHLPGVLAWRGRAIAVLDLSSVLGITMRAGSPPRTVIARIADCTFGFFVETAREARTVDASALSTPHAVTGEFVQHQLTLDGRVMPVVDLAGVIESVSRGAGEA